MVLVRISPVNLSVGYGRSLTLVTFSVIQSRILKTRSIVKTIGLHGCRWPRTKLLNFTTQQVTLTRTGLDCLPSQSSLISRLLISKSRVLLIFSIKLLTFRLELSLCAMKFFKPLMFRCFTCDFMCKISFPRGISSISYSLLLGGI